MPFRSVHGCARAGRSASARSGRGGAWRRTRARPPLARARRAVGSTLTLPDGAPPMGSGQFGQQAREALVAHQLPVADPGLERVVVPQQLGVQLLQAALLELLTQTPEAPPVGEPALEDRDLGTALELCGRPHREVEDSHRPPGRPYEPGLVRRCERSRSPRVANGAVNGRPGGRSVSATSPPGPATATSWPPRSRTTTSGSARWATLG